MNEQAIPGGKKEFPPPQRWPSWRWAALAYLAVLGFHLDVVPIFDGYRYWLLLELAANMPVLPLGNFLNAFNFFGHPSFAYGFYMALGQFIAPGNVYLLNLQSIALGVLAIGAFARAVDSLFSEVASRTEMFWLTWIFAFNPILMGNTLNLNTDLPVLVFSTVCLAAWLDNKMGLFALSACALVMSKETGVFIYTGLIVVLALISLGRLIAHTGITGSKSGGREAERESEPGLLRRDADDTIRAGEEKLRTINRRAGFRLAMLLLPVVCFAGYFCFSRSIGWSTTSASLAQSRSLSAIGDSPDGFVGVAKRYIADLPRLSDWLPRFLLLGLNFCWLQLAMVGIFIAAGRVKSIRARTSRFPRRTRTVLKWLAAIYIPLLYFHCVLPATPVPRYVMAFLLYLPLLFYLSLFSLFSSQRARMMIIGSIGILLTASNFLTFDPVSISLFRTFPFGRHHILRINSWSGRYGVRDEFPYNMQYLAAGRLLNQLNNVIQADQSTNIISWGGAGVMLPLHRTGRQRTLSRRDAILPRYWCMDDDISQGKGPQEAYFVNLPWESNFRDDLELLTQYYKLMEKIPVNWLGYELPVWRVQRRSGW